MVDQYQQEVSTDVNVEAVDADVTVLAMNAWEDQFAVVRFNDMDMDAGEIEGNLVQIELTDLTN